MQQNQMKLSQNQKQFFRVFFCISGIYKKFQILSTKSWPSEVISFGNYWLGKAELLKCAKSPRVRILMDIQQFKGSQTLLQSTRQYLSYIFWSLWNKISPKTSFLELSQIFRLFVNILTPDEKYSVSVKASV